MGLGGKVILFLLRGPGAAPQWEFKGQSPLTNCTSHTGSSLFIFNVLPQNFPQIQKPSPFLKIILFH